MLRCVLAALGLLAVAFQAQAAPAQVAGVTLEGAFTQGGLVLGRSLPGSTASLDGKPLRVTADGRFIFGFGRDALEKATLQVTAPDGAVITQQIEVTPRPHQIPRIDGTAKEQSEAGRGGKGGGSTSIMGGGTD